MVNTPLRLQLQWPDSWGSVNIAVNPTVACGACGESGRAHECFSAQTQWPLSKPFLEAQPEIQL